MRITGLATGLDMDEIIKNSMKPYRIKVDQMTQKKDVVEIKQKLYRDVIKDGKEFFNKYFDVAKSDSLLFEKNWSSVSFTSSDESIVSAKGNGGAIKGNYEVSVTKLAKPASNKITDFSTTNSITIMAKDASGKEKTISVSRGTKTDDEFVKELNTQLASMEMTAKKSDISGGVIIETKKSGENQSFSISKNGSTPATEIKNGTNAEVKIKNSFGDEKIYNPESNSITADGITFTFSDVTASNVKITGKTDTKEIKDKLVGFVNDYNKLMEKLNTLTGTKHERGYDPLTAEQKKEMSESEIKLWNERVEKGQLYRDSDITRIANSMKETMRSLVGGTKLETIGIKPVKDYSGPLNGTFTIDEDALTKALEENTEDVMNLFIGKSAPTKEELDKLTPEQQVQRKKETGLLNQLKDTLDKEFMKSTGSLLEKAGYEGSATFTNNTLTKNISNYEKKIKDMEKSFARREQQLYSKYATLETMMNKLNSQQSNLMSQLGMS
ncbi:TPA: flagellar filament capping protein FliD [Clostridium botulinum]|nr:flagellar filament capping protein FliD [Clostridium botulinum]